MLNKPVPRLLSLKQAYTHYGGWTLNTWRQKASRGEVPGIVKMGKNVFVDREIFEQYLAKRLRPTRGE